VSEYVLTLSCPDARGIVHAVSQFLHERDCNILDSQQYGDVASHGATDRFFMRVHFESPDALEVARLESAFSDVSKRFDMTAAFHRWGVPARVLLLVSRHGHCLNDLLYRVHAGSLATKIVAIVSNHPDLEPLARHYDIPFHHLPLAAGSSADAKRDQERAIEAMIAREGIELVVLARYMQILSGPFCEVLAGRAINIHHSFLPSFPGARPYEQAHRHGVKLIGATAHYVTKDLDEGPIIEQDVARIDHASTVDDMTAAGRDVEAAVLARAVRWHIEHRVLINGIRTVVFR